MTAVLIVLFVIAPAVAGLLTARREQAGPGYAIAGLFAGLVLSWVGVAVVVADRRARRNALAITRGAGR